MAFKKGNRLGGRRSARTSNIVRTPTPTIEQNGSDEEMADADAEEMRDGTPPEDEGEDDVATPAQDEDEEEAESSPPTITTIPRKRRGRPPGIRNSSRLDIGTPEPGDNDGSESGTPYRRRRGRPPGSGTGTGRGRGGFRGRRKGAQPEAPVVRDKEGNTLDVVDDEAVVDDDEEGNDKVDSLGNLLGGREYRVRTFTIAGRGERLYMLSTEPARCCGFRDSYLFFTKHPKLYKVLINDHEKMDLIDRDVLPNSYKGRNIGVVTARSVFREFGARIIVGGRRITDDYKVTHARLNGEVEGELADPDDRVPEEKGEYNRNRYVAWFGASEVYRNAGQGATVVGGKPGAVGSKRRNNITVQNWQYLHAREASRFNAATTAWRRENLAGVYDAHTNMMFYPQIMQPTHARWEAIPSPPDSAHEQAEKTPYPNSDLSHPDAPTLFPPVPPVVSRTFTVVDTVFASPSSSQPGYPGPDGAALDPASGPNGLGSIADEILLELPADCRAAFEDARAREDRWKALWGAEACSGMRRGLTIGLAGWPV